MAAINAILMVEDSPDDREIAMRAFRKARVNNTIFYVEDGDTAICWLKGQGIYADRERFPLPGIMLIDLMMPKVNGFELLEWIAAQPEFKSILLVVLAGQRELREVNRAYSLGARSFLQKPLHEHDILNLRQGFPGYWI